LRQESPDVKYRSKGLVVSIRKLSALPLAVMVLGLAACSAEPTVSGAELATAAEDAVEGKTGSRPEIDCGEDSITVVEGKTVDCLLTDPAKSLEYDVTVTLKGIKDGKVQLDVQVAPEPNSGASDAPSSPAGEPTSEPPADQARLEIPAERLATESEDALETETGSRPDIDCGTVNYTIWMNRQISCTLNDLATGSKYRTTITITSIEGQSFKFDIKVDDTPS